MSENGNKPEEKPIVQVPVAQLEEKPEEKKDQAVSDQLTPEKIKELDSNVRSHLCASELNEILKKFNCVYTPSLRLDNNGYHIDVKVSGMAYADTNIPVINPFMFNA